MPRGQAPWGREQVCINVVLFGYLLSVCLVFICILVLGYLSLYFYGMIYLRAETASHACIRILVGRRTEGGQTADGRRMNSGWFAGWAADGWRTDGGRMMDPMYGLAELLCIVEL